MKILLYTDVHFCKSSSIVTGRGKRFSTRLENIIESLNWAENLGKEKRVAMANEAGFGIDAIFPQPETGLFSFIQNMSTKKHPESASVIVYHLKKLDTLNFHVF